jgi:hypothetical protein
MRERSHKKGENYQKDVKHWLSRTSFLTFDAELFGDAYDVTKKACSIGGLVFDFSLRLGRGDLARHILYGESKYRNERTGNVNIDFKEFLKRVYQALSAAETDEADSAVFVFLSNIPPDDWRKYLKNRQRYCKDDLHWEPNEPPDEELLTKLATVVHIVVLSAPIVER